MDDYDRVRAEIRAGLSERERVERDQADERWRERQESAEWQIRMFNKWVPRAFIAAMAVYAVYIIWFE